MKKVNWINILAATLFLPSSGVAGGDISSVKSFLDSCSRSLVAITKDARVQVSTDVASKCCQWVWDNYPPEMRVIQSQYDLGCKMGINLYWWIDLGYTQDQLANLVESDSHFYDKYCK